VSLRFEHLSLKNFGPYRSVPGLDLGTTDDAPVVLVYGENTVGKTMLFSALRWCLYGTFEPGQTVAQASSTLPGRLNRQAEREGEHTLEVGLRFVSDGVTYALSRKATLDRGQLKVTADLRIGAQVVPQNAIDVEIGRLLHPGISEFFLFDAELMGRFYERLQTDRERAIIRESIEKVLGVPALKLAEIDIGTLAEAAAERAAKDAKRQSDATAYRKQIEKAKADIASHGQSLREATEDLVKAREKLTEINAKLKAVEGLQGDIHDQETFEAQIADGDRELTQLRVQMRELLAEGWLAFAVAPLKQRAVEVETRNTKAQAHEDSIKRARTRVAVLEDRIRGGACEACGQPLPDADADTEGQLKTAQIDLTALLTEVGGPVDLMLERSLRGMIDQASATLYADRQNRVDQLEALQYQRRAALAQVKDRLQGHDSVEIRGLGVARMRIEHSVDSLEKALQSIQKGITDAGAKRDQATRLLGRVQGVDPKSVLEANFFGFTRAIFDRAIAAYREQARSRVETSASDLLLKMISDAGAYGGLRIGKDFSVDLLDPSGRPRETSEGGKQLVALALIGALKQAAVRGGPVVLDSPLARLDLTHRENVLNAWVQALDSQVILFVQSGELTQSDARRIMGRSIAREYRLTRPTNDPEFAQVEAVG